MFSLYYGFATWAVCDSAGDLLYVCDSEVKTEGFINRNAYFGA